MSYIVMVCEIGINHNGDVGLARKLIDVAKQAGCDLVKFQKRNIDLVYTKSELSRYRESPWGKTNRAQKEGLEFDLEEYKEIDRYCKEREIQWFASPWDPKSVEFLMEFDNPYTKIASAGVTDIKLLEAVRETGRPVIISTGMSDQQQVDLALEIVGKQVEYLLACTSTYPTADCEMNLKFIETLKREYPQYKIGFSNHSPGIIYTCCAAALGAEMLEFHITLDRAMYGSDQAASIEVPGVWNLGKHVRNIEEAMGDGGWRVFPSEKEISRKLRR
ncbi:MAG: N-acetylneuraminate synthase family protein [Candidatus Thorarchaeota archaeon]